MRAAFVKRFGHSEMWTGWGYRQVITIASSNVDSDLTDFPLKITESGLDASFWNNVSRYGDDILVTDDSDNRLDRELVFIDRDRRILRLYVRVPLVSSTSDTEIRLYYGSNAKIQNSASVWNSSYRSVLHLEKPALSDSTADDNSVNVGSVGSSWKRPTLFREVAASAHVGVHQGIAWDGTNFYLFDTNEIIKTDASFSTLATNTDPNGDTIAATDHVGDGDYYDGVLYVPVEMWGGCGSVSGQIIAEFSASDLSYITEHDISAQGHEVSSLVVEPDEDRITVTSYCNDDRIYQYRLSDMSFIRELSLSSNIENMQGITRFGDYYYITSDTTSHDWIYRVRLDGTVDGVVHTMNSAGNNNIEGITHNSAQLLVVFDTIDTDGDQRVITLDPVAGAFFDGEDPSIDENYPYATVSLQNPSVDGTLTVWFAPADNVQRCVVSYAELGTLANDRASISIDDGDNLGAWDSNGLGWIYTGLDPAVDTLYGAFYRFESGAGRAVGYNGSVSATGSAGTVPQTRDGYYVGVEDGSWNEGFNGVIEEVRFQSETASDAWLAFEDLSVRSPGSTYSASAEESGSFIV